MQAVLAFVSMKVANIAEGNAIKDLLIIYIHEVCIEDDTIGRVPCIGTTISVVAIK
jgi:hypothetical protein